MKLSPFNKRNLGLALPRNFNLNFCWSLGHIILLYINRGTDRVAQHRWEFNIHSPPSCHQPSKECNNNQFDSRCTYLQ